MTTNSNKHSSEQRRQIFPTRKIDFQVDTIPEATDAAAYFSSWINTITENYVEGADNSFNQSLSTLAHEQKHRDNHKAIDVYTVPMSLEQQYKLCCYDEISANTCELLQLRQEYLAAKTPENKQKVADDNPKFAYYFNAVKNGTINPESKSPAEFDKEMRFIAVETQKMWMNNYAERYDKNAHADMTEYFFKRKDYSDLAPNDANYNKVRQTYMTCGGIDFSKYIDDIPCINDNVKEADKLIAKKTSREQITEKIAPQDFTIDLPMSIEEYANLQFHHRNAKEIQSFLDARKKYLSAKTEAERQNIVEENGLFRYDRQVKNKEIKIGTPDKPSIDEIKWIAKDFSGDTYTSFGDDIESIQKFYQKHQGNLKSNTKNYQAGLKKIYKIEGIDFSPYILETSNRNLHITNASKKAEKNQPIDLKEFREYGSNDITIPANFRTTGLSPQQQFELARKQMFIENMLAQNSILLYKDLQNDENFDETIKFATKDYAEQIRKDPETKKNWDKAERQLAEQIAKQNSTTLILDKASDADFKKAMANLNILPCKLDITKYTTINIDAVLKEKPIPNCIKEIENSSWTERLGNKTLEAKESLTEYASSAWNTTKEYASSAWNSLTETYDTFQAWLSDTPKEEKKDDTKAPYNYTSYQGDPKYPEWSKDKRVSPIQHAEIYDFSSNFLLEQQKQLIENMPESIKKVMKRDKAIADEVYARKASKTTEKSTTKQTTPPRRIEKVQVIAPQDNTKVTNPKIILDRPIKNR